METKFRILRIIGTLWKILAWIVLVGGILASLGMLVVGLVGSGGALLRLLGQEGSAMPGAFGLVSSIAASVVALVTSVIYFLILYATGELIYLLLAIEENTRGMAQSLQRAMGREAEHSAAAQSPSS